MAEGFWARLFGFDNAESEYKNEGRSEDVAGIDTSENMGTTLQDAVSFIAELQSYYYNDICKMQADLAVQTTLSQSRVNFIKKKLRQEQVALSQIDQILE